MKMVIDIDDEQVLFDIKNQGFEAKSETDKVIINALYNGTPLETQLKKVIYEKPDGERIIGFLDTSTMLVYFNFISLEAIEWFGWKEVERMSLREEMWKYEQITGESAEHVPIIKLGAFLDGYEMGLKALEQQPSEDCINRESVIEWLKDKDIIKTKNQEENARRELAALPSVTPSCEEREKGECPYYAG